MDLRFAESPVTAFERRQRSGVDLHRPTKRRLLRDRAIDCMPAYSAILAGLVLLDLSMTGCVSKSKSDSKARAAFLAGQQQAVQQLQPPGPSVTVIGEVKNKLLPWAMDLTLAKALLAAEYYGAQDPAQIIIIREGQIILVDPRRLLEGEDIPLLPRDIVEVRSGP